MGRKPIGAWSLFALLAGCGFGSSVVGGPARDAGVPTFKVGYDDDLGLFRQPDAIPIRRGDVSCGGTAASLTRRNATALLLIDRSGSMDDSGTDGTPKWQALLQSLHRVLPQIDADLSLGLVTFPSPAAADAGRSESCLVSSSLAVEPALGASTRVLAMLDADRPSGNTPTFAALDVAGRWFASAADLAGDRYVILATDGAPNCNAALSGASCRSTGGGGPTGPGFIDAGFAGFPDGFIGDALTSSATSGRTDGGGGGSPSPQSCLDGDRTVARIEALRRAGIETYVIGLNGVQAYGDVLDAMATAGGRARASSPRYYSASSADELVSEFTAVTSAVVGCRFRLDAPPPDPTLVDLRLDGASLTYDVSQRDGWDWSTDEHREIVFHGRTCDLVRAATGGSRLVAAFGCPAPVPP